MVDEEEQGYAAAILFAMVRADQLVEIAGGSAQAKLVQQQRMEDGLMRCCCLVPSLLFCRRKKKKKRIVADCIPDIPINQTNILSDFLLVEYISIGIAAFGKISCEKGKKGPKENNNPLLFHHCPQIWAIKIMSGKNSPRPSRGLKKSSNDDLTSLKGNTAAKKETKKAGATMRGRSKKKPKGSIIISLPDYQSFRNMSEGITDPRERAKKLGTPPKVAPRVPNSKRGSMIVSLPDYASFQNMAELIADPVERATTLGEFPKDNSSGQNKLRKFFVAARKTQPRESEVALLLKKRREEKERERERERQQEKERDKIEKINRVSFYMTIQYSPEPSATDVTETTQGEEEEEEEEEGYENEEEILLAFALYDFTAEQEFELSFVEVQISCCWKAIKTIVCGCKLAVVLFSGRYH